MKYGMMAAVAAACTVAAFAASDTATAAEAKLKAASFLPERASFGAPFYRWTKEVNKVCTGKVSIDVVGPDAVKAFEQPNALKDGVIDMMNGPSAYYKGIAIAAESAVLANVPPDEQRKNGAWALLNKIHNEKLNAQYLTHIGYGVNFFIYTSKEGKNGRFDGMRIRTAPVYDTFFKELGAQTVKMAPPEVYTALERGTVDGYGWPLWGIADFGWQKHTKYRYGPGFFSVVVNILANLDRWKGMSEDQRKCLTDMAVWLEGEFPKWKADKDKSETEVQDKAGVKYVDLGPAFSKRAADIYWADLEKSDPANVKALKKLLVK